MLQFYCISCGEPIESTAGTSLCQCNLCNVQQPVPVALNPEMLETYNRAGAAFRIGRFYESSRLCDEVLTVFPDSASAHWLALLSEYGVEYIRTPDSPVARIESGFLNVGKTEDNIHYIAACECGDSDMGSYLAECCERISAQQETLLNSAASQEEYDVFIACLPGHGEQRNREDRHVALQVFHKLTAAGLRVYMRGVCGAVNEAAVFTALHTASVMLLFAQTPSQVFDIGLQNDWSRYLRMAKAGGNGQLILLSEERAPRDLPDVFLQLPYCSYRNHAAMGDLLLKTQQVIQKAGQQVKSRTDSLQAQAVAVQYDAAQQRRELEEQKSENYEALCTRMRTATDEDEFALLVAEFRKLSGYREAQQRMQTCERRLESLRYADMEREECARLAAEQAEKRKYKEDTAQQNKKKRANIAQLIVSFPIFIAACAVVILLFVQFLLPMQEYRRAEKYLLSGKVEQAREIYEGLGDFRDSEEQLSRIDESLNLPDPIAPFALER